LAAVQAFREHPPEVRCAADLAAAEREDARLCDELHAALMAELTQAALDKPALQEQAQMLARSAPKRLKAAGEREVHVQFQRGPEAPLRAVSYRRRPGDAFHREKGLFPAFVLLGLDEHCSPAAAAQMARSACAVASLEEAAAWLRDGAGLQIDIKTLRRVTRRLGQRARAALPTHVQDLRLEGEGRRLVISVDGGRLRVRQNKAGARTAKGRHRYHTHWREPLLLHIYALGPDGRLDRSFSPLIDGTLGSPEALFQLLRQYLPLLLALQPTSILLIADGALWIWKRFDALRSAGLLGSVRVLELIDFYHAVEHLTAFADACPHYPRAQRTRWRNHARSLLRSGRIDGLLADRDRILASRKRSDALRRKRNYFLHNRDRFRYAWARHLRLPIGSGPMESAIRRVINLRLKGPGIFWHEDSAQAMLLLRSSYKAQRWNELAKLACNAPLEALKTQIGNAPPRP